MSRRLKSNTFVRGLFWGLCALRSWFPNKKKFMYFAHDARIVPPVYIINCGNVSICEGSSIGPNAYITAKNAHFIMKPHSVAAERLTVHTGNHARVTGRYVTDITELDKPRGYDHDVTVEEDVWMASNVTLLSGVTIGRGTTIAAGAVVAKSMPPYCVCGGVPARVIKFYWTIDQILEHESKLYPENERYTREQLEEIMEKYK